MKNGWLEIQGLQKSFEGIRALADFSCSLRQGEVLGLIGPNGAGKTTLYNVMSGFIRPEEGRILFQGKDLVGMPPHKVARLGVSRTFQNLRLIHQLSVLDNVLLCFRDQGGESLGNVLFRGKKCKEQEAANREEAMSLLDAAGLSEKAKDSAEDLSYGQQKLLSLVCCLAAKADLLLLDEPVAGIAPEMIEKVLGIIQDLPKTGTSVMLIEHDLDAVMQVCDRVVFMDAGAKVSEGTPEEVRNDPRVIEAYIN